MNKEKRHSIVGDWAVTKYGR